MPASYLKIGGELVQDAILESVTIAQELNQHSRCDIECRQTEDRRFPAETWLGEELRVFTYDESGAETVLFDGFVLESQLVYEIYGSFRARITAVTHSHRLDLAPHEAYFRKSTLPAVASAITSPYSISTALDCPALPPRNYVQWGETDFSFLKRIAADHQAWLRPTPRGIEIRAAFTPGRTLVWREEDGLDSFTAKGRLAPASFGGVHYDARTMTSTRLSRISNAPSFTGAGAPLVDAVQRESRSKLPPGAVTTDHRSATADEFRSFLELQSMRSIAGGVTGHGVSRAENLRAGDTVTIDGVLDAAGAYGLVKVVHRWTRNGYRNEFWCTPAKVWLDPAQPSEARMGGVVCARVAAHHDPRRMGRIQVQYDWQSSSQTAWARMLSPHAGGDRGFLFLPEIGDEVLIAFEHGDPERPYIVGSLWNGVDHAPRDVFWGGDVEPNDVKRIVTKSGHRIQLSDKPGKESIVLATPRNVKVALLENADETERPMLLMHSAGDIVFSAPAGRIHFHSAFFSREVGANAPAAPVKSAASSAAASPPAPRPDFAAQAASLRLAASTGTALCAP